MNERDFPIERGNDELTTSKRIAFCPSLFLFTILVRIDWLSVLT